MANAAITFDALKPFEVQPQFPVQVALDHILAILNGMDDLRKLSFVQVLRADAGIDFRFCQDHLRIGWANAEDIPQRDFNALFAGNFDADDACHTFLSLAVVCGAGSCR